MNRSYNISTKNILLVCFGAFSIVLIARLLIIHFYGVDVPYWDQWDVEATQFYLPYINHTLKFQAFFAQANSEHRVFFTRVLNLIIFILNGKIWSPLLEMQVQSIFPALTVSFFTFWHIKDQQAFKVLSIIIMTVIFSVPLGWENLLWGSTQSQFYCLILFSIIALRIVSNSRNIGIFLFGSIVLFCICAFFSMANGMITTALVGAFLLLNSICEKEKVKFIIFGILLVLLAIIMLHYTPPPMWEKSYRIDSLYGFFVAFSKLFLFQGPFAHCNIIFWTPMFYIIAALFYKGYKKTLQRFGFPLLLYGWVLLNLVAIAYERRGLFANRYTGIYLLIVIAAVFTVDEFMRTNANLLLEKVRKISYILIALLFIASTPHYLKHYLKPTRDCRVKTVYSLRKGIKLLKTDPKASLRVLGTPPLSYPVAATLQAILKTPGVLGFLPKSINND